MECCQCDYPWVQSDGDVVVFFGGGEGRLSFMTSIVGCGEVKVAEERFR